MLLPLLLLAAAHSGAAIKCYTCSDNSTCSDEWLNTTALQVVDCTPGEIKKIAKKLPPNFDKHLGIGELSKLSLTAEVAMSCQKMVIKEKRASAALTIRSCMLSSQDNMDPCSAAPNSQNFEVSFCEQCQTDLCNAAPTLLRGGLLALLLAAALF